MNPSSSNFVIKSDRLAVEIAAPGTAYRGTRFDWNGFVTQATLDGAHTFCVPESYQPGQGTGGIGLCNEFNNDQPLGYTTAKAGDVFAKLGIGLLKRPDTTDYNFFRTYEIEQLFPVSVETGPDRARFVVEPLECQGLAARLVKTLSVKGNQLLIDYQLENVGPQALLVNEYCHNFVGIDQQPIGPDYRLSFPYELNFDTSAQRLFEPDVLSIESKAIGFSTTPQKAFYCRPLGFSRTDQAQWELRHLPSGVGMREYDDFAPLRVAVWGVSHVISAEIFVEISLLPGEKKHWSRRYEFLPDAG